MEIAFLSKSRGGRDLILRIRNVLLAFGITSKKFQRMVARYSVVARNGGCVPTFPITAVVAKRHANLMRRMASRGIEFAIHGFVHIDYSTLSTEEQAVHYRKAIDIFQICRIPFTGFRAPFLRFNEATPEVLCGLGFPYDSSSVIAWDVVDKDRYPPELWKNYLRLLGYYHAGKATQYLALPRSIDGLVEIPVSIPDDEAIVERLHVRDKGEISKIWSDILRRTHQRGELFTVQLHPERILLCDNALLDILREAQGFNPPVWITTLREIATWWKEKENFALGIYPLGSENYRVQAKCSEKATLLVRNCKVHAPVSVWSHGYHCVSTRDFTLECSARPVIGVSPDSSPAAVGFLKSEGFFVEHSDRFGDYGLYLDNLASFNELDEKSLSEKIEKSGAPLLRFWRWPNHTRSALSVTGDIDSVTIIDFVLRIFENWRQSWIKKR